MTSSTYPWRELLLSCIVFCTFSLVYLFQQSIWTDEATQMSGLALGPWKVLQWLNGTDYHLGVPSDRMPPLSYWIGQIWAAIFGLNLISMRVMSLTFAVTTLLIISHTAYYAFGKRAAVLCSLLFATSPNLVSIAVEIRPYALFLLFVAAGIYFFLKIFKEEINNPWSYAGLAISCLGAIYTHFYGFLFTAIAYLLLLFVKLWQRNPIAIIITAIITGIASLGALPFIFAAMKLPNLPIEKNLYYNMTKLTYHLLLHASILYQSLMVLSIIGAIGLFLFSCAGKERNTTFFLILFLIGGFAAVCYADWHFSSFKASTPSYNIWMLPIFFLILSAGISTERLSLRNITYFFAFFTLLGPLFGSYQLATHGTIFSHGPYNRLKDLIQSQQPDVSIVYDKDNYGMPYYALVYLFDGNLPQYEITSYSPLQARRLPDGTTFDLSKFHQKKLIAVQPQDQSATEIQEQLKNDNITPLNPGPLVQQLMQSSQWQLEERKTFLALLKLEVFVFEKKE